MSGDHAFGRTMMALFVTVSLALTGLFGAELIQPAASAQAAPASTANPIPGGRTTDGGVTPLCYSATGFTCTTGSGYNGTSGQIGGNGWTSNQYWSFGSASAGGARHNCTTYIGFRLQQNGIAFPGWTDNATNWDTRVPNTAVDQTPTVGSVAQWNSGTGHVAYVEIVTSSYIVTTSDSYGGGTDELRISVGSSHWPDNFIHFNDLSGERGHIVQWNADTNPQKTSWVVGADLRRRWIKTASVYNCLKGGGVLGPDSLPSAQLSQLTDLTNHTAPCGADFNGDGIVNYLDLSVLASEYNTGGVRADANLDGVVNYLDLSLLASQFGRAPSAATIGARIAVPAAATASTAATATATATDTATALTPAAVLAPTVASTPGGTSHEGGNAVSAAPSVSTDGNTVVFVSQASNLVAGDSNAVADVFVWHRLTNTVQRVSLTAAGAQANASSADAHISPDGRYVLFDTTARLTADDTDAQRDVYTKDLVTGALTRVSQPTSGPTGAADGPSYANSITSAGLAVFESTASNLVAADTNGASDVFVRQLPSGPIEQVSLATGGAEGSADSFAGSASADGRYIAFASRSEDLTGSDSNGASDVFVRDRTDGTTTLVSRTTGGASSDGSSGSPTISADGGSVAFDSDATDLASGEPSGVRQVYVRDLNGGQTTRVSQSNDGTAGNQDSTEPAFSGDGNRVTFRSLASNLVPGDTNGAEDIFVQDRSRQAISRVSVTDATAAANGSSFGPVLDGDGRVVVFASDATNLGGATGAAQIVVKPLNSLLLSVATPTITGAARTGATLTANPGAWGPAPVALSYRWSADGILISGATAASYIVPAARYGQRISVTVTGAETGYASHSSTSALTAPVTFAAPTAAGAFGSLPPARVLDTRTGVGAKKAALARYSSVAVTVAGVAGVPSSGVSAVVLNVTVTAPTGPGYLTVYGDGRARPKASNLNFVRGQTVPNLVVAPVGADGKVVLYNGSGGTVQLIADVAGYYRSGAPTVAGAFGSVPPARVLDTRAGVGAKKAAVAGGGHVAFTVAGVAGVPSSGVSAVVLNVTVTAPSGPGYLTVYGDGRARPKASSLNFVRGQTVPNLVVAPVGADGKVVLYNGSGGTVQLIADVAGYYRSGAPTAAGAFGSVPPARVLDTRIGVGAKKAAVAGHGTVAVTVAGLAGVPSSGVSAVVLNVTVTAPSGAGYLTAYGDGFGRPTASNLNFVRGQTVPNLVLAPVGADGKVVLYNGSGGTVQLIADVAGYYRGASK